MYRCYYSCRTPRCDWRWRKDFKWLGFSTKGPGDYCRGCGCNCYPVSIERI